MEEDEINYDWSLYGLDVNRTLVRYQDTKDAWLIDKTQNEGTERGSSGGKTIWDYI
ncbi:MAG: hypothetical protein LUH07_09760 [Lachnospiraceae bacterium]|nr:hypothetical protein [Lachnospiraceae bacterium]